MPYWALAAPTSFELVHLDVQAAPEPLGISDSPASKPTLLREGKADIWDSREIGSADPWVIYTGPALASRTPATTGRCASGQRTAWQATGRRQECREIRPVPRLRKAFPISKPFTRDRVYSSGLAYNDLAVNGHHVRAWLRPLR